MEVGGCSAVLHGGSVCCSAVMHFWGTWTEVGAMHVALVLLFCIAGSMLVCMCAHLLLAGLCAIDSSAYLDLPGADWPFVDQ